MKANIVFIYEFKYNVCYVFIVLINCILEHVLFIALKVELMFCQLSFKATTHESRLLSKSDYSAGLTYILLHIIVLHE